MNQRSVSFKHQIQSLATLCHIATFLAIIPLTFLTGCASYKPSAFDLNQPLEYSISANQQIALNHPLYCIIPRHRCQIKWYDLGHWTMWALFGNDDDGIFGEDADYRPKQTPSVAKAFRWQFRNPLHNFCFYVIGSAHRPNSEVDLLKIGNGQISCGHGRTPGKTVFPYKSSCLYFALHGGKPFLSLRLAYTETIKSEFYIGWRERGNFGLKFLPIVHRSSKKKCSECQIPAIPASETELSTKTLENLPPLL